MRMWAGHVSPVRLLTMLLEAPGGITRVSLDPIPENICPEAYAPLFSLELESFMERLSAIHESPSENEREDGFLDFEQKGERTGGGLVGSAG